MSFWVFLLIILGVATALWVVMNVLFVLGMCAVVSDVVNTADAERKE